MLHGVGAGGPHGAGERGVCPVHQPGGQGGGGAVQGEWGRGGRHTVEDDGPPPLLGQVETVGPDGPVPVSTI